MKRIERFLLRSFLFNNVKCNTDVSIYDTHETKRTIDLLYKINEGHKIIYDYCENIQIYDGIILKTEKPNCMFNFSYIDNDNNIHLFKVSEDIRKLFKSHKDNLCKLQDVECGEFTIALKILDTINNAITIITNDVYNKNIWNNMKIIDFDEQYNFLKYAINNVDIITNITLKKAKTNLILTKEKNKLQSEMNDLGVSKFIGNVYYYIGKPIDSGISFLASVIGNSLGQTIEKIIPDLGTDTKFIVIIILIILLKRL